MSGSFKPICEYFNTPRGCRFGDNCKYRHILKKHFPFQKQKNEDATVNEKPRRSLQGGFETREKVLCENFINYDFCKYGRRCRYIHAYSLEEFQERLQYRARRLNSENGKKNYLKKNEKQKSFVDEADRDDTEEEPLNECKPEDKQVILISRKPDVVKKPRAQHKKICWYYRRGHCKHGDECKFKHAGINPNKPPKSIDVVESDVADPKIEGVDTDLINSVLPTGQDNSSSGTTIDLTGICADKKEEAKKYVPRHAVEEFNRNSISAEDVSRLRCTEIDQLKKRFPSDKLEVVSEDDSSSTYRVIFCPSDPDWPYDVKEFQLEVEFPSDYPLKLFSVVLPGDERLPETVRRYTELSLQEWLTEKQDQLEKGANVMLVFRTYLRWIDRNIEDIVTEGLKQYKRELLAGAAGFQFIPASQLQADRESREKNTDLGSESETQEPVVKMATKAYKKSEEVEIYTPANLTFSEEDKENETVSQLSVIDETPRGTEIMLRNLQLKENAATLICEKLMVIIKCTRCKNRAELVTPGQRVNSIACVKCNNSQLLKFRPILIHQFSNIMGYLDLDGCVAFDVNLLETSFQVGCLNCSSQLKINNLPPGQPLDLWCHSCHQKMQVTADFARLAEIEPSGVDTGLDKVHEVKLAKPKRLLKDPAIQEGKPLPETGTCKHYKKSFRWLRFPCCGNCYPCDICHDEKEGDHEMKFANRMICGFCCKEQMYGSDKPCLACHKFLTKRSSAHWEGGQGCRDKLRMSKSDAQKYKNQNKTVSKKSEEMKKTSKTKSKPTTA